MRIGILGATGYVGSNVLKYLRQLEYTPVELGRDSFENFNFRDCDVVINCAWVRLSDIQDLRHLDFARQAIELMEVAKRNGVRIINIGSHNEYSLSDEPLVEDGLCEPIDTYGLAKLMVTLHAKKLGFNTLRLAAVYGNGGRTFKDIANKEGAKYAMPENVKDFVHIDKVCFAVERLLHAQHLYGEIINVSSGMQESAEEIAREVEGAELRWHKYKQRQYEPYYWVLDNTKMIKMLNLKP